MTCFHKDCWGDKMLYIFVEGPDDHNFFDKVFGGIWGDYQVIEYAHMQHDKINGYLNTIKSVQDWDYLFFCDEDRKGIKNKRLEILKRFHALDPDKLYIVQVEIESWYYAGVSQEESQRLKMRKYQNDTNTLTKEQFYSKLQRPSERKYIMAQILEIYAKPLAKTRNTSFSSFYSYIAREPVAVS